MTLEDLGYTQELESYRDEYGFDMFGVARVVSEHKERYVVKTAEREYEAEIIGNLRYAAEKRSDFPAVGDWVAISEYDEDKVLIHSVFPRTNTIERQAVGRHGEKQIIATNIDTAFIVQAVDRDFNINRIERYLTICNTSNVNAVIILNKIDLIEDVNLQGKLALVRERVKNSPVIAISNISHSGIERVIQLIKKGKTYCLLGSSGVGKSTLLNILSSQQLMKTNSISSSTNKGRHVTSHRELIVLENGGIVIDNPGLREVGIIDSGSGLEQTFDTIMELSKECRFANCTHTSEAGCAVLEAVERGELDEDSYKNFLKMEKEKEHFESTVAERRKKDKDFGKIVKHYKKTRKSDKY